VTASILTGAHERLIGRDAEAELIDAVVDQLPDRGGALLLRGEPGIGKSALLQRGRDRAGARGTRTLAAVGVESEAELAFAGLHQLLQPLLGRMQSLPQPQRRALEAAFGISGEVQPDPFNVAMAALQVLSDAADATPIVLVVDDAHWLDQATMGVLTFVARRLESEPVALLAAVRTGYETRVERAHLPVLDLMRLDAAASGELLDGSAPDLHPVMRARVLAEAAGNPLALLELARSMPVAASAGDGLLPGLPTLTERLEQAFTARLGELPTASGVALLAAALDGRATLDEIVRSVAAFTSRPAAPSILQPPVAAGLVQLNDADVRFRHPLVRSAVRQSAAPGQVRRMYETLSEVIVDPERRLWHRAAATDGPDEEIAAALEAHARAARGRGAVTAAAAALQRAAALSAEPQAKAERLVSAAEVAYDLGLVDDVRRLVAEAQRLNPEARDRARLAWLEEVVSGEVWFESGATKTFVDIAEKIREGGETDLALRSLVPIAHRAWWTRTRRATREYLVRAAQGIGFPEDDPRVLAICALADPEVTGASVLHRVSRLRVRGDTDAESLMFIGIAAEKAGDFAAGARFLARATEGLREQVRLAALTQCLSHYAWATTHTGEWGTAAVAAAEAQSLAGDTRQLQYGVTAELVGTLVAALRGNAPDLDARLSDLEQRVLAMKGGALIATAHLARGASALGEGRNEDAFEHLWPVFDESDPAFHRFMRWTATLDLVESALGSGQTERVSPIIAELESIAATARTPLLSAQVTCARPLLADADRVEELFSAALAEDLTSLPFLRARTLFSYGRWLRRQRHSADSRGPLRGSITLFDSLGATAWSRRARQELRASGETIGQRTPDVRDHLTAQELQIAQLASNGLSNREIGERLFLSPRTVGGHLYRLFPKLGVSGRAQLRDALAGTDSLVKPVS
jgi:DNA-binding CsgD family transcriptional regulator